ncbi:Druantia anti-phage system protein DruA [Geitlerinema sp. PCC 7407]|uniref:Druantia anti-phage system protein DruA n=1 Tax=Geitlerinema sp. PCC 7407 TaxID=1173025 RepID=UPI00029FD4E0|nr:Druantia anti-phage system protein DruA [Geitlerinema sp. PCC 7407]AFY66031.1 hypothetical protein GEI7407_1539 [Geitlerinema sp. PCC 7407]
MEEKQKQALKRKILQNLRDYGVIWNEKQHQVIVGDFREVQRKLAERTNLKGQKYKSKVQKYLAQPSDIDISKINPYLVTVESRDEHQRLWAYATSHWSVPVTVGYGRRIRYFVFDRQNNKLIGIVGLCDPVIGLGVRDDESIGWTKDQKTQRLYNCMTAYILGAIPPYNQVLSSKLVALTLMFPKVRKDFYQKYKDSFSVITRENKKPYLAYIDTLGAFGKSSIYNRLINWEFINYTKGQSHLHITANGSWELIRQVVQEDTFETYKFGQGPNWKMRTLRRALRELGLSEEMLSIGWQRGYYRCTLAENWQEYLLGKTNRVVWKSFNQRDLVSYWHKRWVTPRLDVLQASLESYSDQ